MIHQNSIDSYDNAKKEIIPRCQKIVYDCLINNGPMTANEIHQVISFTTKQTNTNVRARLTELREAGLVFENKKIKCPLTGQSVTQWKAQPQLIMFAKKKKTKQKKKMELLASIDDLFTILDPKYSSMLMDVRKQVVDL